MVESQIKKIRAAHRVNIGRIVARLGKNSIKWENLESNNATNRSKIATRLEARRSKL